jgi:hypothetical protein
VDDRLPPESRLPGNIAPKPAADADVGTLFERSFGGVFHKDSAEVAQRAPRRLAQDDLVRGVNRDFCITVVDRSTSQP